MVRQSISLDLYGLKCILLHVCCREVKEFAECDKTCARHGVIQSPAERLSHVLPLEFLLKKSVVGWT